ncbi:MAG: acetyl-CoA decarbonylase/synthase complex subunit delta [Candidatus Cloacimonetes bacterium]|nr:acetyl-CoA decarbonylase/synthase complex subunit delta [Candidatus Cloacimonadota bacterium]
MEFEKPVAEWKGKVQEIILSDKVIIGGEKGFPNYSFDEICPNRPAIAIEVNDVYPEKWPDTLKEVWDDTILKSPVERAKKAVEEFGADIIFFDMIGTHQDRENISAAQAAENMNSILRAVDTPVMIRPDGNFEKQNKVFTKCCELAKRQIIIGSAHEDNYRTITASALASNHYLIAEAPIDVNIQKQLNILITQMNFPIERIIMDPLTGGLGYGFEYTYSVMERIRLQTFNEDHYMIPPMICCVGQETWKVKEIRIEGEEFGSKSERGVYWETVTAIGLVLSGANIVVVRHPESVKQIKKFINSLYK